MKIYTKSGDKGETGLYSGRRVSKDDPLLGAYGTVDELNALLGICRSVSLPKEVDSQLARIQSELFVVGGDLASPWNDRKPSEKTQRLDGSPTRQLEEEIDRAESDLAPLKNFILPGGSKGSSLLHFARTVCRRAERNVASVVKPGRANPEVLIYLNRLADWLFVQARWVNFKSGISDVPWKGNQKE